MMPQISQTILFALTIFSLDVFLAQATVSDACEVQTLALEGNDETLASIQSQVFERGSSELEACTRSSCTIDESKYSANYLAACTGAGGKVYLADATYACVGGTYLFKNEPFCVGKNCTASDNKEQILNYYAGYTVTKGSSVCSFKGFVEASGSSRWDTSFGFIMLSFSSLLGFLLY